MKRAVVQGVSLVNDVDFRGRVAFGAGLWDVRPEHSAIVVESNYGPPEEL